MRDSTCAAPRTWSVLYVVRRRDGRVVHVEKSNDGCTRSVVVR